MITIATRKEGDVAIMTLSGRFDAHEVPEVRRQLENSTRDSKGKLVLNLSGINFIDSSGLASLVQAMKHCREAGGDLHLSDLGHPVRIIFELTRLDKAFTVFEAEAAAISAFQ